MKNGKRIVLLRRVTITLVFVAVVASLAFDIGWGRPSAFGIGEFFLLCPLGGFEAMLASKSFLPAAAISMVVVFVFALLFGRAWCAWGCPVPPIRTFFRQNPKEKKLAQDNSKLVQNTGKLTQEESRGLDPTPAATGGQAVTGYKQIVSAVARDSRMWVLIGVLLVTFIVGIPVFCLVCPIGLTFGTVSSLWHLIVDKQVTASAIVFPIALMVEIVIYKKWCANLCPIAALLGIFGHAAKLFRPKVDASACLLYTSDKKCNVCTSVCAENINMHTASGSYDLGECTRCGECMKSCPTSAISVSIKPSGPVVQKNKSLEKDQSTFLPEDEVLAPEG